MDLELAGQTAVIAGRSNVVGASGDGGLAVTASVLRPTGVAVDTSGNVSAPSARVDETAR